MSDDYSKIVKWCNILERKIDELSARIDELENEIRPHTIIIGGPTLPQSTDDACPVVSDDYHPFANPTPGS